MSYLLLLLTLFSYTTRKQQNPLVNTRWEYKVNEDCINYVYFKENNDYEDYNCEITYPFSGKYEFKKDTIYLIEIDFISDLPENTKKDIKSRMKGIIQNDQLKFFDREDFIDEKWVKPKLNPIPEIFYKKVNHEKKMKK